MSVIWSGITEEGAVVPVQVTAEGKVVAVGDGPQGDYLPITGGELTGDLEVDGSITAAGNAQLTKPRSSTAGSGTGSLTIHPSDTSVYYNFRVDQVDNALHIDTTNGADQIKFGDDGSITAAGQIVSDSYFWSKNTDSTQAGCFLCNYDENPARNNEALQISPTISSTTSTFVVTYDGRVIAAGDVNIGGTLPSAPNISLKADGSGSFAGGSCGFTADGELIFTSRGARYKMFVSNGVCSAEVYTRQMELKEKAEQFKEGKVEPRQGEVTTDNDNA